MAKLGDAFSEPERRKSVLRRLLPGTVVYLEVAFPEGRKNKFLVVASVESDCCTFVTGTSSTKLRPPSNARPRYRRPSKRAWWNRCIGSRTRMTPWTE